MVLKRDAIIATVCATTIVAASWLPWQEDRASYDFGRGGGIAREVTGWSDWNPWISGCAIAVALIEWVLANRDARARRFAAALIGAAGLAKASSCYVALLVQPDVRPALGLGITVVGLAVLVAMPVWNAGSTWIALHDARWIAATRLVAIGLVGLALAMLSYVSPDDLPRDGMGGEFDAGPYRVTYELDGVGISLVVVMDLPGDSSGVGFTNDAGHRTTTHSFRSREPVTFQWTHANAEIGATRYDLSRGRVLCLAADEGRVRSSQLPLQPRAVDVRSRFRWSHHGVEEEVRRLAADPAVVAATTQLRED